MVYVIIIIIPIIIDGWSNDQPFNNIPAIVVLFTLKGNNWQIDFKYHGIASKGHIIPEILIILFYKNCYR